MPEIKNYTEIVNKFIEPLPVVQNHFLFPQHSFRACIVAPSGSGKTNIVMNLLLGLKTEKSDTEKKERKEKREINVEL